MSDNFKMSRGSQQNAQITEQVEQDEPNSTLNRKASNTVPQFRALVTPKIYDQSGSRVEQGDDHPAASAYGTNGKSQFRVPHTPRLDARLAEQLEQDEYPMSGIIPPNGASQFRALVTPFPSVGKTPLPNMSSYKILPTPKAEPISDPRHIKHQVARYTDWLARQAKQSALNDNIQEINDYVHNATKVVKVRGKEIEIFAPFQSERSALQTFTTIQVIVLCILGVLLIMGLILFRVEVLTATIAAITLLYFSNMILNVLTAIRSFQHSPEEQIDDTIVYALKDANWPLYTILCPLYREAGVVSQFVEAIQKLDYPAEKLQVLFLTEVDDVETRDAIRALSLPLHFKIVTVPDGKPRTKPRACNFGLMQAEGEYIVIYDAEDIPDPLQLKKAVLTFANHGPNLACVQAKLNFYNPRQNLLTRMFTLEYSLWFDLILPGLQGMGFPLPLGGTSNHFQTRTLRALGGWDAFNVTEDCDLGLRLAHYHFVTQVLNSTTYEEANSQVKNWLRQRSRWIKGYMQTYLINMRQPLKYLRPERLYEFFSLQLIVGGKTATYFINPLMWILLAIYILFRSHVEGLYHTLFPTLILYLGVLCLIFGNFFHFYIYLLGCGKRKQDWLVKWALLIPLYWAMMSIAAMIALYELLIRPHYWQKTKHGLHLKSNQTVVDLTKKNTSQGIIDLETVLMPSISIIKRPQEQTIKVFSVTSAIKAITTLPLPAFTRAHREAQLRAQHSKIRDPWFIATVIAALTASIAACIYFYQQHQILLYDDANSHLRIARGLFDSLTPGFTQLGGVWLPLPHLLMVPFVTNDFLWRSGLAGSLASMPCYILTAVYIFRMARLITKDSRASFLGTMLFIINPNVLYLQSTPLSELLCVVTLTMACYYFLIWACEGHRINLVLCAFITFLSTLARYDGWALLLVLLILIGVIGWIKHQHWEEILSNLLIFGTLATLGIILWLLWCQVIFGDPLYFQHSQFSSQAQQVGYLNANLLYTYHNIMESIRYYTIDSMETLGPIIFVLAIIAIVVFIYQYRSKPVVLLPTLAILAPFPFYVASLFSGQAIILVPGAVPSNIQQQLFNVRYGAQMVAPFALFMSTLMAKWSPTMLSKAGSNMKMLMGRWTKIGPVFLALVIITQTLLVASGGVITVQDGEFGNSCGLPHIINIYLAEHYAGGRILEDIFTSKIGGADAGVDFKDIIYEGSGEFWYKALQNPATLVDWVIVRPADPNDVVSKKIDVKSAAFLSQFTFVLEEPDDSIFLYHRIGRPPLPTRPAPSYILTEHRLCGTGDHF